MTALASLLLLVPFCFGQSFESWAAKAERAQKKGESNVAIDYWGNALRIWRPAEGKSRRVKALSARAALYSAAGAVEDAAKDLNEALELEPKSAKLHDQRGALRLSQGKLESAISDFYAATKASVEYGPAYFHRAQAYEKQGDKLFAAEDYKTACRLGVKDACGSARSAETQAKAAKAAAKKKPLGKTVSGEETSAPEPQPAAQAPAKPKEKPVDLAACRSALRGCMDRPTSLDICVKKARVCENSPGKGCCPLDCLELFKRADNEEKSDSELFREVFSVKGSCAELYHGKVE